MRRSPFFAYAAVALAVLPAFVLQAQPGFADPQRTAKLAGTFAAIDSVFREHARSQRVPGAAWGIVVDRRAARALDASRR